MLHGNQGRLNQLLNANPELCKAIIQIGNNPAIKKWKDTHPAPVMTTQERLQISDEMDFLDRYYAVKETGKMGILDDDENNMIRSYHQMITKGIPLELEQEAEMQMLCQHIREANPVFMKQMEDSITLGPTQNKFVHHEFKDSLSQIKGEDGPKLEEGPEVKPTFPP